MSTLLLVAGMPASGKTTFASLAGKRLRWPVFSKDTLKEILFNTVGFGSREEKVALGEASARILCAIARAELRAGRSLILESNFSAKDAAHLREIADATGCRAITVLLGGDVAAIYRRFVERDQSPQRHRGHVVNTRYPEPPGERPPYAPPMTQEQFEASMVRNGICDFSLGETLRVDTSSFKGFSWDEALENLDAVLSGERKSGAEGDHHRG